MAVLWVDAQAGLAGDMLCAALLDAGAATTEQLGAALGALGVEGWSLATERVQRGPFAATRFIVHDHTEDHHHHRHWPEIRGLIEASGLPTRVRERALAAFTALAEAEAGVHGVPLEHVAFHEVGAIDSIVDIVGACWLLDALDVDRIVATPLPLGSGTVDTAHGRLAIPVPATVALMARVGWPSFQDGVPGERVTPTGAALITALAEPGPMPSMRPSAVGYGAGTRNPDAIANVVRVVVGDEGEGTAAWLDLIAAQVDDMPGEWVPPLLERLLEAGAADAWVTPVLMKKGRPGHLVQALADPDCAEAVGHALLRHASTFGVRRHRVRRTVLERSFETVDTPWGPVPVKLGHLAGAIVQRAPEYDVCSAHAREHGIPVARVYRAALAALDLEP